MEQRTAPWQSAYWSKLSRRRLLAAAAGMAGAATLAACGSKTSTSGRSSSTQAAQPRAGGKLNFYLTEDPASLDGANRFETTGTFLGWTNDRLLRYAAGPQVKYTDLTLQPSLADKYETPDAQVYTFHLHPGVTFANLPPVNGRALTADDVKYTFEYLSRAGAFKSLPAAPSQSMFEGIDTVETPDPATVVVRFKSPFAPFLNTVASEFASIQAHEVHDLPGGFDKNAVGTGPWQIDTSQSKQGQHWVFNRNQTYWRKGLPYIDQATGLIIKDNSTATAAFETKQLDIVSQDVVSTYELAQQASKSAPGSVVFSYQAPTGGHIYMNISKPPLNDARVRKAFNLSLDRDAMIQSLSNGKGTWALSGSEPGLFTDDETKKLLPHDPQQAKQLMAAAGYANGVDLTVIYPGQKYGQILINQWQLIQQQVKPAGINLVLQNIDSNEESNRKRTGDFQLEMSPKVLTGDLDDVIFTVFYSKSSGNYGRISDPKLDQMLLDQRKEPDVTKRRDLWRQIATYVAQNDYSADLYYPTLYQLFQGYVKNYAPNQGYRSLPLLESWLDK
jgi:peptide/nickel transport system substrate-binding protein